jgi:dienelactone hydrolase
VTDEFQDEIQQFAERGPMVRVPSWRLAPEAWRWVRRLDRRHVNMVFRLRSARAIPFTMRARFGAMGIPDDIVDETLATIRSIEQWGDAWIETAQRFLGDYRRQTSADTGRGADEARRLAALCYHIAQILMFDDERTITLCRASTASLFAQAQPRLYPFAHRLLLPWRTGELPAYLLLPEDTGEPSGVVVMLNGTTTAKEETFGWSRAFLRQRLAVVVIDSPGTGEATHVARYSADHVDILDGVFELVSEQPNLDVRRISVVGVSMGGNQAIRALAYDRRILAAVTVTPVYDPARWIRQSSPLLREQIQALTGDTERDLEDQSAQFSLEDVAGRARKPVLVHGAGRDLIVPPGDAQLLAAKLGAFGTLNWFADGGHCLYDRIPQWTSESAAWLNAIGRARIGEGYESPVSDARDLADIGRQALMETPQEVDMAPFDDDIGDYARLVPPDKARAAAKPGSEPASHPTDVT